VRPSAVWIAQSCLRLSMLHADGLSASLVSATLFGGDREETAVWMQMC
jgi:hypothetical protein